LTALSDAAIDDEVEGSREDLRALLGSRPVAFAYPYGRANPCVISRVGRCFDLAFVVQVGRGLNTGSTDPLAHLRSLVEPRDTALDVLWRARSGVALRGRLGRR
jgi:peptidoglycan/xylan/chitin deacetylase (PgdA/CDA1 family)